MEAKAQARFVRVTPMKARRVINEIRGMRVVDALDLLEYAPYAVAPTVKKILNSALANARVVCEQNNERFEEDDYTITAAYVDEGPTMKRIQPRAQGRANRILKRTSHITVIVGSAAEEVAEAQEKKGA